MSASGKTARPAAREYAESVDLVTPTLRLSLEWPMAQNVERSRLQREAYRWTSLSQNRERWNYSAATAAEVGASARDLLCSLRVLEQGGSRALTDADIRTLADATQIEVSVPYTDETQAWEARTMPWEVLLTAATRGLRSHDVTITRQLRRTPAAHDSRAKILLYVESSPGLVGDRFDFSGERRLVEARSSAAGYEVHALVNPTRAELQSALRKVRPAVVHLAGIDNHQATALGAPSADGRDTDGYVLRDASAGLERVDARTLSMLFNDARCHPDLVVCNIWHSGARLAPLLVASGARAAVGFQDVLEDALAERFIDTMYASALSGDATLAACFTAAYRAVKGAGLSVRGSAIVLWCESTQIESQHTHRVQTLEQKLSGEYRPVYTFTAGSRGTSLARASRAAAPAKGVRRSAGKGNRGTSPVAPATTDDSVADARPLAVFVRPVPALSYALLHNDQDLFEEFRLVKYTPDTLRDVEVLVEWHVGMEQCRYSAAMEVSDASVPLTKRIRLPLTSALARSVDEAIRTTLMVHVTDGTRTVLRQTFSVPLIPVDTWEDSDANRKFLPSFVFPRDPAVWRIVDAAKRYAVAIRDDPNAGWEGYQAVREDDPQSLLAIDDQVQALWYAMMYEGDITYINPPATYTAFSQRVRSPSDIYGEHRGTCIDLALLVAACLEYVEIHPVIVLLSGHAFPGYWRSERVREEFLARVRDHVAPDADADGRSTAATADVAEPWMISSQHLALVQEAVRRSELIPLESVGITGRQSFAESMQEAGAYFDGDDFELLIDIRTAREANVTPLPLNRVRA